MMKKLIAAIVVACVATSVAQADIFEYEPGAFDKISVRANANIVYRNVPDSTGFVRYEADKDFGPKLDVSCNKGKLSISERMTDEDYGPLPTIYLYSDYLVSASYEGDKTMDIDLKAATPTMSLSLTGNGKIVCEGINSSEVTASIGTGNGTIVPRGRCHKAMFRLTGTGVIQADMLAADEVNCNVLGTGSIGCHAIDKLNVKGIGTTKIYYYGNPTVKKLGGAKLEHMPDPDTSVETE